MKYRIRKDIVYGGIIYRIEARVWYWPFWMFVTFTSGVAKAKKLIEEIQKEEM